LSPFSAADAVPTPSPALRPSSLCRFPVASSSHVLVSIETIASYFQFTFCQSSGTSGLAWLFFRTDPLDLLVALLITVRLGQPLSSHASHAPKLLAIHFLYLHFTFPIMITFNFSRMSALPLSPSQLSSHEQVLAFRTTSSSLQQFNRRASIASPRLSRSFPFASFCNNFTSGAAFRADKPCSSLFSVDSVLHLNAKRSLHFRFNSQDAIHDTFAA
jgi:hypothetical protein